MTWPRTPSTVGVAYVVSSTSAALAQYGAGLRAPVAFVAIVVVTTLALRFRSDRWTTALKLLHLSIAATGEPPRTIGGWAVWCVVATSLAVLHLLTPWLPWRHEHLASFVPVYASASARVLTCAAASAAAALLAANV